jgi:GT2 family glycosyltransferase
MRVEPAAIQNTIEYLDAHPDAGVVGGRLAKNDGSLFPSVRHFPDFWSQLIIMCKLPHLFAGMLNRYLWKDFDYTKEQSVEVVRGSYFAIHEQAWKKFGPWDARYFLWFEEVDYCKQVIGAGMKVMYVPTIHATDFVSQSFKQVHLYTSQARLTNSLITYFKRWHPRWQSLIFQILRPPLLVAAWIVERGMKLIGRKQYKRIET